MYGTQLSESSTICAFTKYFSSLSLFSSNLERHPTWSPWLRSVSVDPTKPNRESTWTLQSKGVTISWRAQNTIEERPYRIQWESLSGLPNKGLVVFEEVSPSMTYVELTISYDLPSAIAKAVGNVKIINNFIESTLEGDLLRFKKTLLKEIREGSLVLEDSSQ